MNFIVNAISVLTTNLAKFFTLCKTFFQSLIDFFSNLGSIISTLWFGLKTMLSGIWSLIVQIFDGTLFGYLYDCFNDLSTYIGFEGALFISSLLFIVMIRIAIAFVFKLLRMNIDYHNTPSATKTLWQYFKK